MIVYDTMISSTVDTINKNSPQHYGAMITDLCMNEDFQVL